MKKEKKNSKRNYPVIILSIVIAGYFLLFLIDRELFQKSVDKFTVLAVQIIPILVIVFILMFLNFWFLKPDMVKKHLGSQSGVKGYIFAILSGIISVGSVYVWYPLLKDLRKSGMSNKLIAVFIYNRSIKLHLLPLMILYFGVNFTVSLTILTVIFSIIVGYIVQKFDVDGLE